MTQQDVSRNELTEWPSEGIKCAGDKTKEQQTRSGRK